MDFLSISITMTVFSFFVFLWITFFYIRNRTEDSNLVLLLSSSFFMFVSLLSFHLEFLHYQTQSIYTHAFSFVSYSCMLYSVFSVVVMISELYKDELQYKRKYLIIYSLISGVIFAFNSFYGTYAFSFVILLGLMLYPMFILAKALYLSNIDLVKSPFVYQIGLIAILYTLKMINLIMNPSISSTNADVYDSSYSMLILIVLVMFNVTYLLESNHILKINVQAKSEMLSIMLNKAKAESETDTLTRIPNRAKLNVMLDVYFKNYVENGTPFSIAMIDVDNFKYVNDKYGHLIGDKVLTIIANNLQKVIRKDDLVGRFGGDEFIVIFPNTSIEHNEHIRNNLARGFTSLELQFVENEISISMGFANSNEVNSIIEMIQLSDKRMYQEKRYLNQSSPVSTPNVSI